MLNYTCLSCRIQDSDCMKKRFLNLSAFNCQIKLLPNTFISNDDELLKKEVVILVNNLIYMFTSGSLIFIL